jgi:uncharacterized membrane protein YbaN (DUF454 family)
MATTRTAAGLRGFGKPVLAGVLVLLLSVSALASASPSLHHWLHADHQTPSHYCLVTVLDHGQTDVVSAWVTTVPIVPAIAIGTLPSESRRC